ncbi:MAG: site-2 protease family protein [Patescibacteria group bacterium]
MDLIISLAVLLFSVILHEIAHGSVAEYFGDDTARVMGRITINPIVHLDLYFSFLIPIVLYMSGSPIIFGAAKPVPVNYSNLKNFRWGVFWVSIAGILTNFLLAMIFAIFIRVFALPETVQSIFVLVVQINIFLAVINMIPIPPIDGSKVLAAIFGENAINFVMNIEMRGFVGILPFLILIYVLFYTGAFQHFMLPIAGFFFRLFGIA